MASALDVGEYILSKYGTMTAWKLQKLVYYSQAWNLVRHESALFAEPIEAWADGPVVRALYERHRGMLSVSSGQIGGDANKLSAQEKVTIDKVLLKYGPFSGNQLSELTHREQPWLEARKGLGPTERGNNTIDPSVMVDYYGALARRSRSTSEAG